MLGIVQSQTMKSTICSELFILMYCRETTALYALALKLMNDSEKLIYQPFFGFHDMIILWSLVTNFHFSLQEPTD